MALGVGKTWPTPRAYAQYKELHDIVHSPEKKSQWNIACDRAVNEVLMNKDDFRGMPILMGRYDEEALIDRMYAQHKEATMNQTPMSVDRNLLITKLQDMQAKVEAEHAAEEARAKAARPKALAKRKQAHLQDCEREVRELEKQLKQAKLVLKRVKAGRYPKSIETESMYYDGARGQADRQHRIKMIQHQVALLELVTDDVIEIQAGSDLLWLLQQL